MSARAKIAAALFVCVGLCATGWEQQSRGNGGRQDDVASHGCPAAVPPATSNSVATAGDYVVLRRTRCYGTCVAYEVRVSGDGAVAWEGVAYVETMGKATGAIDSNDARALMQRVAERGFWRLCESYSRPVTDNPSYYTTLSIAGHTKTVQDYAQAAPSWLRDVDAEIDRVADTHRWRHGEASQERFGDNRTAADASGSKAGVTRLMRVAAAAPVTSELITMLEDKSLNLNAVDSSGWTAMMYAAQAGIPEAVYRLIQAGARVDQRSNEGETAVSAAVSSRYDPELKIKALIAAGVNINAGDKQGVTPLMLAARQLRSPNLIAAMVQLGADPSKRDRAGRNALAYLQDEVKAKDGKMQYPLALYRAAVAALTQK